MNTYPYEIHITISDAPSGNEFRRACEEIGVKPVLIDLQLHATGHLRDVMTSSTIMGESIMDAHHEAARVESEMGRRGWSPIRRKIETAPWNPLVEQHQNDEGKYFETHISIRVAKYRGKISTNTKTRLKAACQELGLHVSSNMFKSNPDYAIYMTTLREFGTTYDAFKKRTEDAIAQLEYMHWQVEKHVIEFALFDSNVAHDDEWMRQ